MPKSKICKQCEAACSDQAQGATPQEKQERYEECLKDQCRDKCKGQPRGFGIP